MKKERLHILFVTPAYKPANKMGGPIHSVSALGERGAEPGYADFYTVQLLHVCSRLWPAKSLGSAHGLGKTMMLEEFMPEDFIYRPKSGFVPPWRRWLQNEKINQFTRESLLGGTGYIATVLREEWIERILKQLKKSNANPPTMVLNTMWGALSTELWLQKTL